MIYFACIAIVTLLFYLKSFVQLLLLFGHKMNYEAESDEFSYDLQDFLGYLKAPIPSLSSVVGTGVQAVPSSCRRANLF